MKENTVFFNLNFLHLVLPGLKSELANEKG